MPIKLNRVKTIVPRENKNSYLKITACAKIYGLAVI